MKKSLLLGLLKELEWMMAVSYTHLTRLLGVVMALMVYSFVSSYSWNWLFCKDIVHEQVQVVDFKEIHTTKGGSSYYLYIDTSQQKHVKLECSKNIYEKAKQTHHVLSLIHI